METIVGWVAIGIAAFIGAIVVYWVVLHIPDDPWNDNDDWMR